VLFSPPNNARFLSQTVFEKRNLYYWQKVSAVSMPRQDAAVSANICVLKGVIPPCGWVHPRFITPQYSTFPLTPPPSSKSGQFRTEHLAHSASEGPASIVSWPPRHLCIRLPSPGHRSIFNLRGVSLPSAPPQGVSTVTTQTREPEARSLRELLNEKRSLMVNQI